jgi:predicted Zn-dependent protease
MTRCRFPEMYKSDQFFKLLFQVAVSASTHGRQGIADAPHELLRTRFLNGTAGLPQQQHRFAINDGQ